MTNQEQSERRTPNWDFKIPEASGPGLLKFVPTTDELYEVPAFAIARHECLGYFGGHIQVAINGPVLKLKFQEAIGIPSALKG
jgi:hypothetical protein